MKYVTPKKYHFPLHHIRPRFKRNREDVLLFISKKIFELPILPKKEFIVSLNSALREYPGNSTSTLKTINNWRTEISSLLGLIEPDSINDLYRHSKLCKLLVENEDLVQFFKYFLFKFQYPGCHLKTHEVCEIINKGIKFHPASYILRLLIFSSDKIKANFGISKTEATHCIFNDLRVTRDSISSNKTLDLIRRNREKGYEYDKTSDVTRYAGDILDYMKYANFLILDDGLYYINKNELSDIMEFLKKQTYFPMFDKFYKKDKIDTHEINSLADYWFLYVNDIDISTFKTKIENLINIDRDKYAKIKESVFAERLKVKGKKKIDTKAIGDKGESIVYSHECFRLNEGGRKDLVHLIKCIPNQDAAGYDIRSMELNGNNRHIEVKTTISNDPVRMQSFHMTRNEWRVAQSLGDSYFVYRLMINREEKKMILLQNPFKLHNEKKIFISYPGGVDINFDPNDVGEIEEILGWIE